MREPLRTAVFSWREVPIWPSTISESLFEEGRGDIWTVVKSIEV